MSGGEDRTGQIAGLWQHDVLEGVPGRHFAADWSQQRNWFAFGAV